MPKGSRRSRKDSLQGFKENPGGSDTGFTGTDGSQSIPRDPSGGMSTTPAAPSPPWDVLWDQKRGKRLQNHPPPMDPAPAADPAPPVDPKVGNVEAKPAAFAGAGPNPFPANE